MMFPRENYNLKWSSFSSHLHACVASALTKENFADVYLYTMDGRRILAHRFVLSASSQYLHDILKTQQRMPTTLPLVVILPPEINHKTLSILIRYMYSGEATVSKNMLKSVLRAADLLKVKGLWRPDEKCCDQKLIRIQERNITRSASNGQHDANSDRSPAISEPKILETSTGHLPTEDVSEEKFNFGNHENADVEEKSLSVVEHEINKTKQSVNINIDKTPVKSVEDPLEAHHSQLLTIKKELTECNKMNDSETEMTEDDVCLAETATKPEVVVYDQEENSEELYSPFTCELCAETFKLPEEWVKHIQTHTEVLPAKRPKHDKPNDDDDEETIPPLHCDMCQKYFPTPAEWINHIQSTHTEVESQVSSKANAARPVGFKRQADASHKTCTICKRIFNSRASMLIHRRTHTGEKPYMCEHCQKGFNVKGNLLRHLRTIHDKVIKSTDIENKEISVAAWNSNT